MIPGEGTIDFSNALGRLEGAGYKGHYAMAYGSLDEYRRLVMNRYNELTETYGSDDVLVFHGYEVDSVGTGPLILASYREYQRGARNSAADNARISSVLLRREGADFRCCTSTRPGCPRRRFRRMPSDRLRTGDSPGPARSGPERTAHPGPR